jgi:RNA polymerase sigma factor (sigma-70 family)
MLAEGLQGIEQANGASLPWEDDASLVDAAKTGDRLAFEILAERYRRMIHATALRITSNHEDAEDVVQQSLQNAFVHIKEFEGRSSFSTWLTRIAVNEALMLKRRSRRRREIYIGDSGEPDDSTPVLDIADSNPDPEHRFFQQEQSRLLFSAMDTLGPRLRIALEVCALNELSLRETAKILGVTPAAVKSRVNRGRKVLREKLLKPNRFAPVRSGQRAS